MDFALCAQRPHRRRTLSYVEDAGRAHGAKDAKGPRPPLSAENEIPQGSDSLGYFMLLPATAPFPTESPLCTIIGP